ncbi:MAG: response regulator consisting of a CheY-like receiver domain and a Fis-type domain protein [Planctomycetota bacterium]|nr:response regulator consisting of a CheY-like receiver domain and a Fis-type domain protein [Planctomycetota bacterium]
MVPRILIVDDHLPTRRVLARLVARKGWTIDEAADVREALAALDARPDCAILDLMLPDGGGERIAAEIAARGLPTRVVICTGLCGAEQLAAAEAMAPGRVLSKPIKLDDLLAALDLPKPMTRGPIGVPLPG